MTCTVAAIHQGEARSNDLGLAGRPTVLAPPCLLLCFGNSVNRKLKCYHIWPLYLFYFDSETISGVGWRPAFWGRRLKNKVVNFFWGKKCTQRKSDMAWVFSDLEMTCLYCAGAATGRVAKLTVHHCVTVENVDQLTVCWPLTFSWPICR